MYLSRLITGGIFASIIQTKRLLRKIFLISFIIPWLIPSLRSQTMWPGDVNNNGIVNNIDVLYWAVAAGSTGPARPGATLEWEEQNIFELWTQSFPSGLNFAYADCDGNGIVQDPDKDVIEANFGQTQGVIIPDNYANGDPFIDPVLLLSTDATEVAPGETLEVRLSLGDEDNPITDFYGIAFTILYNPDAVGNQGNHFQFDLANDTWVSGMGVNAAIRFVSNDKDNGIAQIAIVRKNQQTVEGFGDLGTFSIVMEDIIVGLSTLELELTDIRMIDAGLESTPVAPSELSVDLDVETLAADSKLKEKNGVNLYPNPAGEIVIVELEEKSKQIRQIQLFNFAGQLVLNQIFQTGESKQILNLADLPGGMYAVRVFTQGYMYTLTLNKKN